MKYREAMLMIQPSFRARNFISILCIRHWLRSVQKRRTDTALKLTSITLQNLSKSCIWYGRRRFVPALFTRTSICPNFFSVLALTLPFTMTLLLNRLIKGLKVADMANLCKYLRTKVFNGLDRGIQIVLVQVNQR